MATLSKKAIYSVTAYCDNPRCHTDRFGVDRTRINKMGQSGQEYRIQRVVCPDCKCLGHIISIDEIRYSKQPKNRGKKYELPEMA